MEDETQGRVGLCGRIRTDLETRGLTPELSQPVAERLAVIAADLSAREYEAVLEGIALAFGARTSDKEPAPNLRDLRELQQMMKGFRGELRKLDEGLRVLQAYLARMRRRTPAEPRPVLH